MRSIRKLATIVLALGWAMFCIYGFLAAREFRGASRYAQQAGYAVLGVGCLGLAVWRARKP